MAEEQKRPTEFFETSGGVKLEIKKYITGREYNKIQATYTEGAQVKVVNGQPVIEGLDAGAEDRVISKMIEMLIVSLNDSPDDILNRVLDLEAKDYLEIIDRLNEVAGKKKATNTNSQ